MERCALAARHLAKLAEYNLQGVPRERCTALRYRPGEAIVREGDELEGLALAVKGLAKVSRSTPDGKNLILCYYLSDGMIGEIELLTCQRLATTTVTAVSAFECVLIDRASIAEQLRENIPFWQRLGAVLADKLQRSSENYALSSLCSAQERLCAYICKNAPGGLFRDPITDVACSVGASYRHVFRLLADLCREGVLQKSKQGYQIKCPAELARRAQAGGGTPAPGKANKRKETAP